MFYATGGGSAIGLIYRHQDGGRATERFAVTVRRSDRYQKAMGKNMIPNGDIIYRPENPTVYGSAE